MLFEECLWGCMGEESRGQQDRVRWEVGRL